MALEYNRQYIGARYVPQFFKNPDGSWDWAQGFQYEPLTIVRYGENSYTSTQLVPSTVGSPNENPTYWAQTGNYNGYMGELQNQINDLKKRNKKYLWLGDSYTYLPGSFINQVADVMTMLGNTFVFKGIDGCGFTTPSNFTGNLSTVAQLDYDYVIVQGILNDMLRDGDLSAALPIFKAEVSKLYPNAKIIILPISKSMNANYKSYLKTARNIALSNGISFEEKAYNLMWTPQYFNADKVHPNTSGNNFIANCILSYLLQGEIDLDDISQFTNPNVKVTKSNGILTFNFNSNSLFTWLKSNGETTNSFYGLPQLCLNTSIKNDNIYSVWFRTNNIWYAGMFLFNGTGNTIDVGLYGGSDALELANTVIRATETLTINYSQSDYGLG